MKLFKTLKLRFQNRQIKDTIIEGNFAYHDGEGQYLFDVYYKLREYYDPVPDNMITDTFVEINGRTFVFDNFVENLSVVVCESFIKDDPNLFVLFHNVSSIGFDETYGEFRDKYNHFADELLTQMRLNFESNNAGDNHGN